MPTIHYVEDDCTHTLFAYVRLHKHFIHQNIKHDIHIGYDTRLSEPKWRLNTFISDTPLGGPDHHVELVKAEFRSELPDAEYLVLLKNVRKDALDRNTIISHKAVPYIDECIFETATKLSMELMHHRVARIIQRAWLAAWYTPTHPVCRRRLLREYESMCEEIF